MPAADSRPTIRMDCSTLSHDSVTCGGSPEVSSTAFDAQPPDLPPVCLVDLGFAVLCQLAPHRRPHHPVLVHRLASLIHASFRPRLATTPLRFSSPSPPPGWAGDFHPQAVEHVRHTKQKAALEGCLLRCSAAPYCAAGLRCTGGFFAGGVVALAFSSCPFSMTIMNGFGVYNTGSPWKSKLAPSFGINLTGTLSSNFSVISAFFAVDVVLTAGDHELG